MGKVGKSRAECGKEVLRRNHNFCSNDCKRVFENRERRAKHPPQYPHLSTGAIGAIGELRAGADLLDKGFEVYRALSPAADADLIVQKDGRYLSIQVRTGHRRADGGLTVPRHGEYDILAIVLPDTVVYEPALESIGSA